MATPKKGSKGKKAGGLGAGKTAAQKKAAVDAMKQMARDYRPAKTGTAAQMNEKRSKVRGKDGTKDTINKAAKKGGARAGGGGGGGG